MNATRPEAASQYSNRPGSLPTGEAPASARALAAICGGVGAAALVVAELLPLQRVVTVARHPMLVRTVAAGPHDGWALLVLGAVAVVMTGVWVRAPQRRLAPAAVIVFGLLALAVALIVDRPGIHRTGVVQIAGTLRPAQVRAGPALYLETLGGVLLMVGGGIGLALGRPRSRRRNHDATHPQQTLD